MTNGIDGLPDRLDSLERKVEALSVSVDQRFDAVDTAFVDQRQYTEFAFARLEAKINDHSKALGRLEAKVDGNQAAFGRLEAKVDNNQAAFRRLEAKVDNNQAAWSRVERKLDQFIDRMLGPKS